MTGTEMSETGAGAVGLNETGLIETGFTLAAGVILLSLAVVLWRVWRGPDPADRLLGAQMALSTGVGVIVLLAPLGTWAALDVALVLTLLAALAAVAFVKATSPDGLGDPDEARVDPGAPRRRKGKRGGRA